MDDSCGGPLLHGTISISIIEARNLPDTDSSRWKRKKDVTDPFVQGEFGGQTLFKTKHIENDLNPRWCETFHLRVNNRGEYLMISVFDKDCIGADFIGTVSFVAEDLLKEEIIGGVDGDWFPITNDGKPQGEIKLSLKFV